MGRLKVGIDSYGPIPLGLEPPALLEWARENGAEGVQFSGIEPEHRPKIDRVALEEMKAYAADRGMYLEWGGARHIPRDMSTWERVDIFEHNRRMAEEAAILGTRVIRSCSGGLMRWDPGNPSTELLLEETAEALREQRSMLLDHGVILSIELHFEFTTFELLRLFERCEAEPGEWLGICLDTMNLLTMLEDPLRATDRILPWVTSTHIKDGALRFTGEDLMTWPTAVGDGIIDLEAIIRRLTSLPDAINLSIEDHGGEFLLPVGDDRFRAEFPDLTADEYASLKELAAETERKIAGGGCVRIAREEWPGMCRERLIRDIAALKEIAAAAAAGLDG
jgi:sugar phosphate isomerase/epimerase